MKIYLNDPEQGHFAFTEAWKKCKLALETGKQFEVEITYKKRNHEQNAKYHAIIGEIATQAQHLGSKWDSKSWKRLLVDAFCKEHQMGGGQVIPNLTGDGIIQLEYQTRRFSKEQASEFIEWLLAWCVNNGVRLSDEQKTMQTQNLPSSESN